MNNTKFDLSIGTVTLDYQELVKTAQVAVRYSRDALEHRLQGWYQYPGKAPSRLDAEWMLEDAKALAIATTALYVLREGLTREVVKIENKPEVKEV